MPEALSEDAVEVEFDPLWPVTPAGSETNVCDALPSRTGAGHLRDQLFRSSTLVAANYAEACVPESRKDFAHKTNVALKELVETRMWLRIIALEEYVPSQKLESLLSETDELIRIFNTSVKTARKNLVGELK